VRYDTHTHTHTHIYIYLYSMSVGGKWFSIRADQAGDLCVPTANSLKELSLDVDGACTPKTECFRAYDILS
jgi:hypothetical protein